MSTSLRVQEMSARRSAAELKRLAWFYGCCAAAPSVLSVLAFAEGRWVGWVHAGVAAVMLVCALFVRKSSATMTEAANNYGRAARLVERREGGR